MTSPARIRTVGEDEAVAASGEATETTRIAPSKVESNTLPLLRHRHFLGGGEEATFVVEDIASMAPQQHNTLTKDQQTQADSIFHSTRDSLMMVALVRRRYNTRPVPTLQG
jgi:hypothetical protein